MSIVTNRLTQGDILFAISFYPVISFFTDRARLAGGSIPKRLHSSLNAFRDRGGVPILMYFILRFKSNLKRFVAFLIILNQLAHHAA